MTFIDEAMGEVWEESDWGFDACRRRMKKATAIVLNYSAAYREAANNAADAEAVYRQRVGRAFAKRREEGEAVEAAKIGAHADCAKFSHARDVARDLVKVAADDMQGALDSRRSLWRMVEWARDRDVASARRDERAPAEQWP